MNPYLLKAQKALKHMCVAKFQTENMLSVYFPKDSYPFMFLIYDEVNHPDTILISFAIDFQNSFMASTLVLNLIHVCKLELAEMFYYNSQDELTWGEEAQFQFEIDTNQGLAVAEPASKAIN